MFSYTNLAIFTKNGTLLPINYKCDIVIIINDDYDGQAVFYPVTQKEANSSAVSLLGYKKIYGGRFTDNRETRRVAIVKGNYVDYRDCSIYYNDVKTNVGNLYTISGIDVRDIGSFASDSQLTFPNVTFSQKLIFDKVSTELFETEFLYVMAETVNDEGLREYKKISALAKEDTDEGITVRDWAERYKLLFFIDCRNQKDFRIFTVSGDEAVWSDRAELDLLTDSLTVSDGTEAKYPTGWTTAKDRSEEYAKSPRVDIGFSGEMEGMYRQALHICLLDTQTVDEHNIPEIIPIGEIELIAETEGEDERYRTLFTNFGIPDPKNFDYVYKDSYVDDDKADFRSINRHSKEMFLEYDKIFPYIGTYKALINAVHLLGYDDIFFKEWYKVLDVSDEIPRGYVAYNMSYKDSGHNVTLASLPIEKRIHLRKKNWLSMMYALNRELYGAPDEYDFPYVEELFEYRTEDALLKLIALREWLEKYVLALNCRIIDIGGEGVYFERYTINAYGGIRTNLEHVAGLNVIPTVEDSSLSDTAVLIDSSAFITVKTIAKMEERRFDDLKNLRFEDFCNGVITNDYIYHTYDGSTEGRYTGTIFAGFNDRYTGKLNAVSTVKDFIIGEDGFIGPDSPRLIISGNEISFIPEDIVHKEKNTAFKRMPVIALERAVLRSFTDTWEKPIKYLIYPENDPDTGVSYFIENKLSRERVESYDYVYLVPPIFEETEDSVKITRRNSISDTSSAYHDKRKHYNFKSDFGNDVVKEYTSDDTMYGFRFSANNAYEIPLISIQGYSLKRPITMEFPVDTEYYLDIIKGKLIFDDYEHGRKIYIIFDTDENGERKIDVKFSYFCDEFEMCKYIDADNYTFNHFSEGENYESFLRLYDEDSMQAVDYDLLKSLKVYNSGEFKVNLSVRDIYGEIYSADAYNTAKVLTLQPLITAFTNEPNSNNEYNRPGNLITGDKNTLETQYDKFCYFWYKAKYPVKSATTAETNNVTYPVYPYSGDMPVQGMLAHYANLSDKFKVVAYDRFITHDDRIDWNYYLILNRQNRYKNTRIVEKNDRYALNELYTGNIFTGTADMARTCNELFEDADEHNSENLDVTVMFYNEVGAFPVIQLPGKILNAKALDNLQTGSAFQDHQNTAYGYYDDEYHLLLSHDITNCYIYEPTDNAGRITSIVDSSGNRYTAMSFMQDGIEWLVKSLFSEGYGSLWEYDNIPVSMHQETIMGKRYAYSIVEKPDGSPEVMGSEGYSYTDENWTIREFEDMPWISGWLTYKGVSTMTYTDASTGETFECRVPAGMYGSELRFRVPSYDPAFGENAAFSPYYAIKQKTIMDTIPDLLDDPNISVYIYPYWHCEVQIIGVDPENNQVYVQFENDKYKFQRAFKPGEVVKLVWQTGGNGPKLDKGILQSSYKVIGYDALGFVLILEGEICGSYGVNMNKKYAYADLDNTSGLYAITKEGWNPKEYEDMPFVDGREGWVTGWLTYNGWPWFEYTYDPEKSFYKDNPSLYRDGSVGSAHKHYFRIPAGMYIKPEDSSDNTPLIRYRVYSHNDLTCPYADPSDASSGIDPNGMFSPHYFKFESTLDASLFISYAYNAFSDYKMPVDNAVTKVSRVAVDHPLSAVNNKLTYFIDDTFKAVYRTFDTDNGILYWMNSSDNKPLICFNDIYSYNCPVTITEKMPYAAFNIDDKGVSRKNKRTILWRVYKSLDAEKRTLLFESWNRSLFLDITDKGIYDIEVNEFDKYGNRSVHMYEGAYRILSAEDEEPNVYDINVTSELVEGEGDYGYVTGGGKYEENTLCVLKAVPYSGYRLIGWTIDGTVIDTNTMLMFVVSNSSNITAKFGSMHYCIKLISNDTQKGSISISPVGTSEPETEEYIYAFGTQCTVTALPNYYGDHPDIPYQFVKWRYNGKNVSSEETYTFTVTENAEIAAEFTDRTFTIDVTSNNNEYGTARCENPVCLPGQNCQCIATLNSDNYRFKGWYENDNNVSTDMIYTLEDVTANHRLTAIFEVKPVQNGSIGLAYSPAGASGPSSQYTLKVNGQSATPAQPLSLPYGSNATLTCVKNTDNPTWIFKGWYRGSNYLSNNSTYNYTIQLPSVTITAKFESVKYTIHGDAGGSEYGIVSSDVEVQAGGTGTLTLNCNNSIYNYNGMSKTGRCDSITVSSVGYLHTFTIPNVQSDINIVFSFTLKDEYEPFYIENSGTAGSMTVSIYEFQEHSPIYFNCMLEGDEANVDILDNTAAVAVPQGGKLYIWAQGIKSTLSSTRSTVSSGGVFKVKKGTNDADYTIGGNIISLLYPRKTSGGSYYCYGTMGLTSNNAYCFKNLFFNNRVVDAKNLKLPLNTVQNCYESTFEGTLIPQTPVLKASVVASGAYNYMFTNASRLKEVYTAQENWDTAQSTGGQIGKDLCTKQWLNGVPNDSTRVFHKVLGLEEKRGQDFIPTNWRVSNDM